MLYTSHEVLMGTALLLLHLVQKLTPNHVISHEATD